MRRRLPSGTVTFLFTDVEGSTRLLHELGSEGYAGALSEHRRIIRTAASAHEGVEVDTQGDAFFIAFPHATGAVAAAAEVMAGLESGPIRVRMGIHTGTALVTDEGYVGMEVHRAARIAGVAHGGQVVVSNATAEAAGDDRLRELGLHRLKDLSAPERLHQLGGEEFPPLRSLYQTNLPVPATPFLGRELELQATAERLQHDDVRLLTLTGPGGTGKTRLAMQAAGVLADRYVDGVWWVPLADLRDPALVVESTARVLGASTSLEEHVGDRRMLLLLDNFEQVIQAGPRIAAILEACRNLDVLVTSREPLRIAAENEYAVPPLAEDDSVRLFVSRAQAVRPEVGVDDTVAHICARLEHLPLAVELAAARVRSLSTTQILDRLAQRLPLLTGGSRDAPDRQRTLQATIQWSYDLLTPDERQLFARVSAFRGGWTLDVAEHVALADLDILESLVDKSLVRQHDGRFSMLETLREYASDRLEASGEGPVQRRRHAEVFLALAEEAEAHIRNDDEAWIGRVDAEHDNLRAALDHFEADEAGEPAVRLAGALSRFWYLRGHLAEGRLRLERALEAAPGRTAARGKALNGAAVMVFNAGQPDEARRLAEEALAINAEIGDQWATAYSTMMIANAYGDAGDLDRGREWTGQALRRFEALGDDHYALICASNLASMHRTAGDLESSRELDESVLARARAVGNRRMESQALAGLSSIARRSGRLPDALEMLAAATRINVEMGDALWTANNLRALALYLASLGRHNDGAVVLGAADALQDGMGIGMMPWAADERAEAEGALLHALGEQAYQALLADGRALSPESALTTATLSGPDG